MVRYLLSNQSQACLLIIPLTHRAPTMQALLKLFLLPLPLNKTADNEDEIDIVDPEDVVYQASFSKLGASERVRPDPVAHVPEPRTYLATSLVAASQSHPGQVCRLIHFRGGHLLTTSWGTTFFSRSLLLCKRWHPSSQDLS